MACAIQTFPEHEIQIPGAEADSVVFALVAAWNSHDAKAWADCFTENADYVNVSGLHWHGQEEIEARQLELHTSILSNSRFRPKDWTIKPVTKDVILVHLNWEMKPTDRFFNWDRSQTRRGIMSLVLVQKDRKWLISSAHTTDFGQHSN
jgi:uncharacterized protein (TIGR02246 family)